MASIHSFFRGRDVNMKELEGYLDSLPSAERIRQATSLTPKEQAALFDAARGYREVTIADIVPENQPPLTEVIHYGRNSMPMFSEFQKRFCRSDDPKNNELWGYNHQAMALFTGPGYYVSRDVGDGEVVVDYLKVPPRKPAHWPEILPNSARLSRFVYFNMQDFLRGVNRHMTIGRAVKGGKTMNNWFVLCRAEI